MYRVFTPSPNQHEQRTSPCPIVINFPKVNKKGYGGKKDSLPM